MADFQNKSIPKRHHYLPQFYLEKFSRNGGVWIYDRRENKFRNQTPNNTALKGHFYSLISEDGSRDASIEEEFARLEGDTKPIINDLENGKHISEDQKTTLAYFVAFMRCRVPRFDEETSAMNEQMVKAILRNMYRSVEDAEGLMKQSTEKKGDLAHEGLTAEHIHEYVHSDRYEVITPKNFTLKAMVQTAIDTAGILKQMDWVFYFAEKGSSFITTDDPFIKAPGSPETLERSKIRGLPIDLPGVIKMIPLSHKISLVIFDYGTHILYEKASKRYVRDMNLDFADHSNRYVIARDEALIQNIVRNCKLHKRPTRTGFVMANGTEDPYIYPSYKNGQYLHKYSQFFNLQGQLDVIH